MCQELNNIEDQGKMRPEKSENEHKRFQRENRNSTSVLEGCTANNFQNIQMQFQFSASAFGTGFEWMDGWGMKEGDHFNYDTDYFGSLIVWLILIKNCSCILHKNGA